MVGEAADREPHGDVAVRADDRCFLACRADGRRRRQVVPLPDDPVPRVGQRERPRPARVGAQRLPVVVVADEVADGVGHVDQAPAQAVLVVDPVGDGDRRAVPGHQVTAGAVRTGQGHGAGRGGLEGRQAEPLADRRQQVHVGRPVQAREGAQGDAAGAAHPEPAREPHPVGEAEPVDVGAQVVGVVRRVPGVVGIGVQVQQHVGA
ncbi:hypothetical protein GCM10022243_02710 [Saccharothrix violaceirubra]